ncbi:hypothetical protein BDE02_15G000700 [Populus trichocarpa]|nr:hypothetical protein BDE02_15G000700 [Populus trichocarpa]
MWIEKDTGEEKNFTLSFPLHPRRVLLGVIPLILHPQTKTTIQLLQLLDSPLNKISKSKGGAKKKKRKGDGDDGQEIEDGTSAKHTEERHSSSKISLNLTLSISIYSAVFLYIVMNQYTCSLDEASNHSVWALSLDSESCHDNSPIRDVEKREGHAPKKGKKGKNESNNVQSKGNHGDVEITEEVTSEKLINAHVSISRLPLVLSEKVQRSKALVECEGESIDLSGEMGAVGRPVIPDTPSGDSEMHLDLKGTIYRTTTVPSRTFYVVSFGQSKAKVCPICSSDYSFYADKMVLSDYFCSCA